MITKVLLLLLLLLLRQTVVSLCEAMKKIYACVCVSATILESAEKT